MSRPEPPREFVEFEDAIANFMRVLPKEPKCCHSCLFYSSNGYCEFYLQTPPAEFVQSIDVCEKWEARIPF